MYVCIYIYIYIHTNVAVNVIVRRPHSRSGDSQVQETLTSKPATMTQSAQATIPPYQS